jgi:predicted Rossmann fold nucleotide-binding protein DprA/Smf involved in DNA uptake
MPERVAIVGSRHDADLEHVERFVRALHEHQPDTLLVSGGADGVDKTAEQLWLSFGGRVLSFRVRQLSPIKFAVERWELGGENPRVFALADHPTWADRTSALFYRDSLIAEAAERLVAFFRRGRSSGTAVTVDFATAYGRDLHVYEAGLVLV